MSTPAAPPAAAASPTAGPPRPVTPARPPAAPPTPPRATPAAGRGLRTAKAVATGGHRVVIYGPGGIGKTTLACALPGPIAFYDLDESLGRLRTKLATLGLADSHEVVQGIATWQELRDTLNGPGWDGFKSIVIDSGTRAEELAVAHVLATVTLDGGRGQAKRIEDYGYGKGYQHLYDVFLTLLADLDAHARAGRNVALVCHDCNSTVPNPMGADWIRYEPRLYTSNTGKASIRLRVKEWADHVLFLGYDVQVKDGKGTGQGTATLYPTERPHFMAKSRTMVNAMPLEQCIADLWPTLLV